MSTTDKRLDRNDFTIQIDSGGLRNAASRLRIYHASRLAWWEDEQQDAEGELREKGISIEEYQQTGGHRLEAKLDAGLAKRLQEAQGKIAEHRTKRDDYANWEAFFGIEAALAERSGVEPRSWDVSAADLRYFDIGHTIEVEIPEAV